MTSYHRDPGEESIGLYPGLVVSDGKHSRVSGSITVGRSRLPIWAFIHEIVHRGWTATDDYYSEGYEEQFSVQNAAAFFGHLMDLRGEYGRLLLVLADAERCEANGGRKPWYETKRHRKRVSDQMRRCLAILEDDDA